MSITIKREKNNRGVSLGSLNLGDTFMYDNRIGVIASRNGHDFPMEFTTCCEFRTHTGRFHNAEFAVLPPEAIVLPVSVELTYKVVG